MNTIQFQSAIKKITTMADNTLDITLSTQELPEDMMTQLFCLKNKHCAVAIAPHGEEIEPFDPQTTEAPKGKTPSVFLRNVLYRVWETDKKGYNSFDQWYVIEMTKIIDHFKAKLD